MRAIRSALSLSGRQRRSADRTLAATVADVITGRWTRSRLFRKVEMEMGR